MNTHHHTKSGSPEICEPRSRWAVLCLAAACLQLATSPRVAAFEEIDHGVILLATTAATTYDSDVQGGPNGRDDLIYSLYPDLLYRRDEAQLKVDAGGGITFQRFQTYTRFNSNDPDGHINLDLSPDAGLAFSGNFDTSFIEKDDVDYDLNERILSKSLSSQLKAVFPISLKTSIVVDGSFNRTDRGSFGTQQIEGGDAAFDYNDFLEGANLSLQYQRLDATASSVEGGPTLDQNSNAYVATLSRPVYGDIKASATYGYRFLDRSAEETDTGETRVDGPFYSASIDGPFLPPNLFPKLKSDLMVAYEAASTPGINDVGGNRVVAAARLSWDATDRTHVTLKADHTQELASNNLTVVSTDGFAEITQDIGYFVHATLGGGYEHRVFQGMFRTDDVWTGYGTIEYRATKALVVGLSAQVHSTSSNDVLAAYSREVVRLYATYTF